MTTLRGKAPSGSGTSSTIVKAGYLLRTTEVKGNTLAETGDLNATAAIEVIGGAPDKVSKLTVNGTAAPAYRVQLYVNGYQFGKYVHNIGPQKSFPVPEGIFNYHGTNWVATSLWSVEAEGTKVEDLRLVAGPVIQTGYEEAALSPMSQWEEREGAY